VQTIEKVYHDSLMAIEAPPTVGAGDNPDGTYQPGLLRRLQEEFLHPHPISGVINDPNAHPLEYLACCVGNTVEQGKDMLERIRGKA